MENIENNQHLNDDEIDLKELLIILTNGKWIIAALTSIASIIAVIYSLSLPNIYQSNAILVPVEASQGMSSALKSYGSIANLAGMNFTSQASDSNSVKAMEKIKTLSFFENNIMPNIFLPDLMAIDSWHDQTNELKFNQSLYDDESNTWVRDFSYPQKQVPSAQESFREFKKHLSFSEDQQTGFINVAIKHQSPIIAKEWVDLLINQINAFYREKDKAEAERAVAYLNKQITKTSLTEIKQVIAVLLQQETQKLTLIEANEAYVFDYIDPPVVMERKSEPYRALICIIGAFIGVILGITLVLVTHFRSSFKTI